MLDEREVRSYTTILSFPREAWHLPMATEKGVADNSHEGGDERSSSDLVPHGHFGHPSYYSARPEKG